MKGIMMIYHSLSQECATLLQDIQMLATDCFNDIPHVRHQHLPRITANIAAIRTRSTSVLFWYRGSA